MDDIEQKWKEYELLRNEIKGADALNYQVLGIMVAAVAALLTTAFRSIDGNGLASVAIVLCVYLVTYPAYRLLKGNRRRIWRISTYLRIFVEPNISAKWETLLSKESQAETSGGSRKSQLSSLVGKNEWFIVTLMNCSATLSAIIITLETEEVNLWLIVLVVVVVLLTVLLWSVTSKEEQSLKRSGQVEKDFLEYWHSRKKVEKNGEQ